MAKRARLTENTGEGLRALPGGAGTATKALDRVIHERLRLGAALGQAALHHQDVQPLLHSSSIPTARIGEPAAGSRRSGKP